MLVVLASYEKLDSRKKVVKELKSKAEIVNTSSLNESEIRQYLIKYCDEKKVIIEKRAIDRLIQLTNANFSKIMNELSKLIIATVNTKKATGAFYSAGVTVVDARANGNATAKVTGGNVSANNNIDLKSKLNRTANIDSDSFSAGLVDINALAVSTSTGGDTNINTNGSTLTANNVDMLASSTNTTSASMVSGEISLAGAGATVPLTGFGYNLAKGAIKGVEEYGLIGAFTGGVTASAGGIAAAIFFGYIASLISKPKMKKE